MTAERWLNKERERLEKAAASDEGLSSWKPPELVAEEKKIASETLAEYGARWIEERNLKPGTRIEYQAKFENYVKPKLGKFAIRDLNPATVRS